MRFFQIHVHCDIASIESVSFVLREDTLFGYQDQFYKLITACTFYPYNMSSMTYTNTYNIHKST